MLCHLVKTTFVALLLALALAVADAAPALRGVIDDPDGFTNLRAEPSADSAIIARVKNGEVFQFDALSWAREPGEWWMVTLGSGRTGYMHSSRIRFHARMAELGDTVEFDDINLLAAKSGIKFYPLARAAAKGEPAAMRSFFAFVSNDGLAHKSHTSACRVVIHLLGDAKLAKFLRPQPADYQKHVRDLLTDELTFSPFESRAYLKRFFPKTAAILGLVG
jgi:Bacterial SH3 domain